MDSELNGQIRLSSVPGVEKLRLFRTLDMVSLEGLSRRQEMAGIAIDSLVLEWKWGRAEE